MRELCIVKIYFEKSPKKNKNRKMTFYKHKIKTEPTYQIISAGHLKINNEWHECVAYQDIHSKEVYVRQTIDFESKFKVVGDE